MKYKKNEKVTGIQLQRAVCSIWKIMLWKLFCMMGLKITWLLCSFCLR